MMKVPFVFMRDARLIVRWSGAAVHGLEDELDELLARYGLERTDTGYDYEEHMRELVFRPVEELRR